MTSKNLKSAIWLTLVASAVALAAPGGGKGPPDDKGNKPTSEASNNLSVPAIIAGTGSKFAINCPIEGFSDLTLPSKPPVEYPEECVPGEDGGLVCVDAGFYYVQRDGVWQAPCFTAETTPIQAYGKWGDNLAGGSASLKVGSPIRVEMLLVDTGPVAVGEAGYFVIKLEPSELDRESDYGHLADGSSELGFAAHPYVVGESLPGDGGTFASIVFDPTATLRIERLDNGVPVSPAVYNGTASGEINATGKIVYGYNLRVQVAGTYRITYTFPRANLTGCNANPTGCGGNTAILEIVVAGGGGGPRRP